MKRWQRWTMLVCGLVMAWTCLGALLWMVWELVLLTAGVFIGFGLVGTARQIARDQAEAMWEPGNYMQLAERLHKRHGYDVGKAHEAVDLARRHGRNNHSPVDCWKLIQQMHERCPEEFEDVPRYVLGALRHLSGTA